MDISTELYNKSLQKKKKRYVLFLYFSKRLKEGVFRTVERAIGALESIVLLKIEDPDEALKILMVKNIDVILMDESFLINYEELMKFSLTLKERRQCPLIYLTSDLQKLIQHYRETMYLYEEMDDYLVLPLDFVEAARRIKRALVFDGRAAKRFDAESPIKIQRLDVDNVVTAMLSNLSLLGCGFTLSNDYLEFFKVGEQVRIHLPLSSLGIFHTEYGETLKLAGKIRRINLDGRKIGCSFQHMTVMQQKSLELILEIIAKKTRSNQKTIAAKRKVAQFEAS